MKRVEWVGQDGKMEHLMRSVQAGRIVHALLFTGPRGTGKRTAAKWFSQALLCKGEDKPCGVCPACKRFLAGAHPDVKIVRPEKNVIKVDAIDELLDYLAMRPYEGGKHIAIIEQADKMNAYAQNSLLKTLENPVGDAIFFLLTDAPVLMNMPGGSAALNGLLSTIHSRCQTVRFNPLSVEECAYVLQKKGVEQQRAFMLAGAAQGSVGRAVELDGDEAFFELRGRVLSSLEALNGDASVAYAASMIAEDKGSERVILEIMELWARDLMAVQNGGEVFQRFDIERLRRSRLNGARLLQAVMLAGQQLSANVSWINVLETMFFGL